MRYNYDTSFEILKIFFKHIQRDNIEVIGRFVQYEEVRITHQHCTKIKATTFSPTQFIDIAVLGLGRKEKMLQKLRSCQLLTVTKFYDFGNVLHNINHFHLFVKLEPILRIISKTNGLTYIYRTTVRLYLPHQYLDKSRLTRPVITNNTHLFIPGKDIREILQYLQITETLV